MLAPCNAELIILLLRRALDHSPLDVDVELVFNLVAQLVTDLDGGGATSYSGVPIADATSTVDSNWNPAFGWSQCARWPPMGACIRC